MNQLFIIERSIANVGKTWVQSNSFPGKYTMDFAQGILDRVPEMSYRIVPVRQPTPKPYRRHAAVTPLELRGAKAMLESTREYICREYTYNEVGGPGGAWEILMDAYHKVCRQLEAL